MLLLLLLFSRALLLPLLLCRRFALFISVRAYLLCVFEYYTGTVYDSDAISTRDGHRRDLFQNARAFQNARPPGRRAFRNAQRSRTRRSSRRRAICNAPAFQNVRPSRTRRSSGRRAFQNVRRSRRRRPSRRARVPEGAPSKTRRRSRRRRLPESRTRCAMAAADAAELVGRPRRRARPRDA